MRAVVSAGERNEQGEMSPLYFLWLIILFPAPSLDGPFPWEMSLTELSTSLQ